MTRISAVLAMLLMLTGCNSTPPLVQPLSKNPHPCAFMEGRWVNWKPSGPDAYFSEETWMPFRLGNSIGMNRLQIQDRIVFFEFLRIETNDDGTFYIAQPKGRSPGVAFTMTEHSDNRVVFENPDHDFPQRIVYERAGDELHASVSGIQNGESRTERWKWLLIRQ